LEIAFLLTYLKSINNIYKQGILMYQIIKKIVRPNESVEFPFLPDIADPAHLEHLSVNYEQSSKNILRDTAQGDNSLERIVTMLWDSKASYDEYEADPVITEMKINFLQVISDRGMTLETISQTEW
jgi:hypothetical protein